MTTLPTLALEPPAILPIIVGERSINLDVYAVHALLVAAETAPDKWAAFRVSFAALIDVAPESLAINQLFTINDLLCGIVAELDEERKKKVTSLATWLRSTADHRASTSAGIHASNGHGPPMSPPCSPSGNG